jgi:2,4-dienoyl-CoA reductase [(3E)-enoyl-CoA-producing], peroxisomal
MPTHTPLSAGGVVVNISATLHYGATWFQAHASAAKAAVDSLTRSLGLEWGSYGVRVVGIAPGPIADTPGMTKLAPAGDGAGDEGTSEAVRELVAEVIPLGRMGSKADIGLAAVFLCSPAASFITGETLVVDGGHWLFKPQMLPREMVAEMSRRVEGKSRAMAPDASQRSRL